MNIIPFPYSSINYNPFDEDLINDLPSCVYANQHISNPSNAPSSLCINTNNLRQIQQQYLHHSGKFICMYRISEEKLSSTSTIS